MRSLLSTGAALALALTAALTTIPAAVAAEGEGQLVINLVDHLGEPQTGAVIVMDALTPGPAGIQQSGSTITYDLQPGTYGAMAITPWGGFACIGLTSCDYFGLMTGTAVPDGSLVVTEGATTTRTITGDVPAQVVGSGRIGSPLTLEFSDGLQNLYDAIGGVGGINLSPTIQWLRDGSPIEGATNDTYTPAGPDAGSKVSAEVSYTGIAASYMQQVTGALVDPITTEKVSISKIPTKAFIRLVRTEITDQKHAVVRFDATTKGMVVYGKATVWIGDYKVTRTLRNGGMVVRTPELKPGTYVIKATYQGNDVFNSATAKNKKLTVIRS